MVLLTRRYIGRLAVASALAASGVLPAPAQSALGGRGAPVSASAAAPTLSIGTPAAAFRAEGQDPFWTLAIAPAAGTVTWGLLGEADLVLAYAPPLPTDGPAAETRYYFRGDHRLKATLTQNPCHDAETGNAYAYEAVVEVGGRRYVGCATREK